MSELLAFWMGGVITFILTAGMIWRPRLHELMATNRELRRALEDPQGEYPAPEDVRIITGTWEDPMELLIGDEDG